MTPAQFKAWRKHLKLSQQAAAELLDLSRNMITLYEAGEREGRPVVVPKTVELACAAIALGITRYEGPSE